MGEVVRAGIEPATHGFSVCTDDQFSKQKTEFSDSEAQPGAQSKPETPPVDPELSALIASWPTLPEPIRRGILAMVEAAGNSAGRASR